MIGYTESEVLGGLAWLVRVVTSRVEAIPSFDTSGEVVRCHELARATRDLVRDLLDCGQWKGHVDLTVEDGVYGSVDHSWLVIQGPMEMFTGVGAGARKAKAILDPYVVGSLPQVRLLSGSSILRDQWRLYQARTPRTDIRGEVVAMILHTWGLTGRLLGPEVKGLSGQHHGQDE